MRADELAPGLAVAYMAATRSYTHRRAWPATVIDAATRGLVLIRANDIAGERAPVSYDVKATTEHVDGLSLLVPTRLVERWDEKMRAAHEERLLEVQHLNRLRARYAAAGVTVGSVSYVGGYRYNEFDGALTAEQAEHLLGRAEASAPLPPICEECGNDHATEGYRVCSDCLPIVGDGYEDRRGRP